MLPEWFVEDEIGRGVLRIVLRGWESEPVQVRALHRREHRGSARVRALLQHLQAAYARDVRPPGKFGTVESK